MSDLKKGYDIEDETILIKRDLTELDLFVKEFITVLKKHSGYLVVSGYVSISTGRARGTEDIDIILPIMDQEKFKELFKDLEKNNFWCYQGDKAEEVYEYIKKLTSIRFAKKEEMFPNIELVPFNQSKKAKSFEFNHPQKIRIKDFEFNIPHIEFEILYKELILKGKKDLDDAKHLRTFFSDIIKTERFKEYKSVIESEIK
jgi:phosphorylcholine metabolism protein LicD